MAQLVELGKRIGEFDGRGVAVLAIAQGDTDEETTLRILESLGEDPGFELLADPGRVSVPGLDWMTTYVVDSAGVVREILPIQRGMPLSWDAVLTAVDEVLATPRFLGRHPMR